MGRYTQVIYKSYSILYTGVEHSRIFVSTGGSWNLSPMEIKGQGTTMLVKSSTYWSWDLLLYKFRQFVFKFFPLYIITVICLWLNKHVLNSVFTILMIRMLTLVMTIKKTYGLVILDRELNFRVFNGQSLTVFRISSHL